MRPIRSLIRPREEQLSAVALTSAAESGSVARDLGYLPSRQTTPPQGLPLGWRRFCDSPQPSGPSRPIVAPSARRAAPLRSVA